MRDFVAQMLAAVDAGLFYVAWFAALAIPDVCGALGSPEGTATAAKYKRWFDTYIGAKCGFLDGEQCYYLRCSALHQGSTVHPEAKYSRVIFFEPTRDARIYAHCNVLNDALNLDIRAFCQDMADGALAWLNEVEGTEPFETNRTRFITRYPNGLQPYVAGIPVIS